MTKRLRILLPGIVALSVLSAPAFAADVAARPQAAPVYKAPAAQAFDWSGFYLGLNGGYALGRSSWDDPAVGAGSGKFDTRGALIGGQVGYNWQTGNTVFGLESDIDWANLNGTASTGGVCATNGGGECRTEQSWFGTTRARLGYSFGNILPYVTGGLAYGDIKAVQPTGTSRDTKAGWTAGGGVEYGITKNWSAKAEYLHIDLGTATFMGAASGTNTLSVPITEDIVRAGLNYHW
ncbi:MAG: outer membrane protein [Pseudolabrys sp.]